MLSRMLRLHLPYTLHPLSSVCLVFVSDVICIVFAGSLVFAVSPQLAHCSRRFMEISHWHRTMEDMLQSARGHAPSRRGAPSVPVTPSLTSDARLVRTTDTPCVVAELGGDEPLAAVSDVAAVQSEAATSTWILDESKIALAAAYEHLLGVRL